MADSKDLFFIALLPPGEVQNFATQVKQHFAEAYQSRHALKSPPHITLYPPFKWEVEKIPNLEQTLETFALTQSSIPVTLEGFGAFSPRVIYINVLKNAELLNLQKALMRELEESLNLVDQRSQNRPFSPHMTVAFRDLTKANFRLAWEEYQNQKVNFNFMISSLTLLRHTGKRWEIKRQFPYSDIAPNCHITLK